MDCVSRRHCMAINILKKLRLAWWKLGMLHSVTASETGKTTTVVSVVDEGGPAAHSLWYAILDVIWETQTWLYWVCVEALQKREHESVRYLVRGIWRMRGKKGSGKGNCEKWRCLIVLVLNNGARGDFESMGVCGESSVDTCEVIRVSFQRNCWICVSAWLSLLRFDFWKLEYINLSSTKSVFSCPRTTLNAFLMM